MNELSTGPDLFDRIQRYYESNDSLSPKELEMAERWELAFALISKHRSKKMAVVQYQKILARKGTPISQAQAYRDMNSAQTVFVPLQSYTKEFLRLVVIESSTRDIKRAEKKARSAKSIKDWKDAMVIKDKAETRLMKAAGIDDQNPDLPDFSVLEAPPIQSNFPPELMEALAAITKKGVVDVTDFMQQSADDAEIMEDDER